MVSSVRMGLQSKASEQDVDQLLASTTAANQDSSKWLYDDCYQQDIGDDTHTASCNGDCEWVLCADGYFLHSMRFTDIAHHDGYELAPTSYGHSATCCKVKNTGVAKVDTSVPALHVQPLKDSPAGGACSTSLDCFSLAISLI